MDLSVKEAASLLGRSPRTVRAQLARGDLAGRKRNGVWRIRRHELPLSEAKHQAFRERVGMLRASVDKALPGDRGATHANRSLANLQAFERGAAVLRSMRQAKDSVPTSELEHITETIEEALLSLAEGAQLYDRAAKLEALHRARAGLARAVGLLLIRAEPPLSPPYDAWVAALEGEVLPAVAGLARWADGLRGRKS